jgi:pyridinium-3,5-biscarboxylic acid mononucleotide sulfurtransferase
LNNWDRPAMACLASRIPYGTPIEPMILSRIDQAEHMLKDKGVVQCRVRVHGNLARIEINRTEIERFAGLDLRQEIVSKFRELGFAHICLDLEGYTSGKMNRDLEP